jgi:hypothetical protein
MKSRLYNRVNCPRNVSELTVSDIPQFAARGGMTQFVADGNRIRFIVNLAAAQRAGLGLSSELLKVAKEVQRDKTED